MKLHRLAASVAVLTLVLAGCDSGSKEIGRASCRERV